MARFSDLETGFEKFLALAYGRHIITGHGVLHSIGLETGGGTGKEVVLLSALGDGAYNEAGEGAWGIASSFGGEEPEEISFLDANFESTFDADHTVVKPTGVTEGDVMLATTFVHDFDLVGYPNEVTAAPAGWTLEAHTDWSTSTTSSRRAYIRLYRKVAGPAEPADYTWSLSNVNHQGRGVEIAAWRAVDNSSPIEAIVSAVTPDSQQTLDLPSITTLGANRLLVVMGHRMATSFSSMPAPWVERVDGTNPFVYERLFASAGATGLQTLTGSSFNQTFGAFMFSLKPASAGSGEIEVNSDTVESVLYAGERLLSNWHYHPGTISTGELDPIQGVDPYFPGGSTYSATPNIAVLLPEGLAEDADHSKLAVILKTSCIADYDSDGNLISIGYSANPARVKADMLKRRGKHTRINWASFVNARDYYDGLLSWEAGDTTNTYISFTGVPVCRTFGNISVVSGTGAASKPSNIDAGDNYAQTEERIAAGTDGWHRIVVNAPFPDGTGGGLFHLFDKDGHGWFGIAWGNGHIATLANEVPIDFKDQPYPFPAVAPVTFELGVLDGDFYMKQNGVIVSFPQGPAVAPDLDLFGRVVLLEGSATLSSQTFSGKRVSSVTQNITQVKRFEAHPAFTSAVDIAPALDFVDFLTASDTQDAGKEIIFLTPEPRAFSHIFDEEINVVGNNIRCYSTDIRERPNRLWAKFRNLDLQFLDQDSVFDLRDELFERVGNTIDPGALNFGSMSASQAQRMIKYWMRRRSDNYRWCDLTGMPDSFKLLPADVVRVLSKKYRVYVSTGYNAAATSIVLRTGDAAKFRLPPTPFKVTWWNRTDYPNPRKDPNREVVLVTAVAGDTLTVTRAQDGTSAVDHNLASKTYVFGRIPKDFLIIVAGRTGLSHGTMSRPFKLQEYYPDDYRDTDHGPQQTPASLPTPSPFACPPTPVLQLEQRTTEGVGGSVVTKIIGTIHFGNFAYAQSVKIYVTKGTGAEVFTGLDIEPAPGTTTGTFEYITEEPDEYTIRAEVLGQGQTCSSAIASLTIGTFLIDDVTGEFIIDDVTDQFIVEG